MIKTEIPTKSESIFCISKSLEGKEVLVFLTDLIKTLETIDGENALNYYSQRN